MEKKSSSGLMRTLIFFILAGPVIWYLVRFSILRNSQFDEKAKICSDECAAQGYTGAEFKWAALSKADCTCLEEE